MSEISHGEQGPDSPLFHQESENWDIDEFLAADPSHHANGEQVMKIPSEKNQNPEGSPENFDEAGLHELFLNLTKEWDAHLHSFSLESAAAAEGNDSNPEAQSAVHILNILSERGEISSETKHAILESPTDSVTLQRIVEDGQDATQILFRSGNELRSLEGIIQGPTETKLDPDGNPEPIFVYWLPKISTAELS